MLCSGSAAAAAAAVAVPRVECMKVGVCLAEDIISQLLAFITKAMPVEVPTQNIDESKLYEADVGTLKGGVSRQVCDFLLVHSVHFNSK